MACVTLATAFAAATVGCSFVRLDADKSSVLVRTLEWDESRRAGTQMAWHPAGQRMGGELFGILGLQWTNTHGFVSYDTLPIVGVTLEGQNTQGLAVSALMHYSAVYEKRDPSKPYIHYAHVAQWILGTCETVAEAQTALAGVQVVEVMTSELPKMMRLHWVITDPRESYILEFVGGKRQWHENKMGVLTNDPSYPWHVENLNNYVALSNELPEHIIQVDKHPKPLSQGTQMIGLPGDGSPASRFVRLFYLRELGITTRPALVHDAILLGTALVNSVQIVRGDAVLRQDGGLKKDVEMTIWASMMMPSLRRMYFRTYVDMQWRLIDLDALNKTAAPWTVPMVDTSDLGVKNITNTLGASR